MNVELVLDKLIEAVTQGEEVQTTDFGSRVVIHNHENELFPFDIEKIEISCICSEWVIEIYPKEFGND